jgi:hypothetical protein
MGSADPLSPQQSIAPSGLVAPVSTNRSGRAATSALASVLFFPSTRPHISDSGTPTSSLPSTPMIDAAGSSSRHLVLQSRIRQYCGARHHSTDLIPGDAPGPALRQCHCHSLAVEHSFRWRPLQQRAEPARTAHPISQDWECNHKQAPSEQRNQAEQQCCPEDRSRGGVELPEQPKGRPRKDDHRCKRQSKAGPR